MDLAGTPLIALTKIVATGDTPEVFNGFCGAKFYEEWQPRKR